MRNKEEKGPNTHQKNVTIKKEITSLTCYRSSLVRENQGQYYMHIDLFKKKEESDLLNQLVFLKCFHSMSSASQVWCSSPATFSVILQLFFRAFLQPRRWLTSLNSPYKEQWGSLTWFLGQALYPVNVVFDDYTLYRTASYPFVHLDNLPV